MQGDVEIVRLLIENGATVNLVCDVSKIKNIFDPTAIFFFYHFDGDYDFISYCYNSMINVLLKNVYLYHLTCIIVILEMTL